MPRIKPADRQSRRDAFRVMRAGRLGIRTVAIYSQESRFSPRQKATKLLVARQDTA